MTKAVGVPHILAYLDCPGIIARTDMKAKSTESGVNPGFHSF